MKKLKWFIDRIGKRVYRDHIDCCSHCEKVYAEGLLIHDSQHAEYLHDTEAEYAIQGISLNYRDEK